MNGKRILATGLLFISLAFISTNAYAASLPADIVQGGQTEVEIAWSRTTEPVGYAELPIAKWSWDDVKDINYDRTSDVWDGGTVGNKYIRNAKRSWDIATWFSKWSTWTGRGLVRRFHGEFTIPAGYNISDSVMLSSVGDYSPLGLSDIIAINDNIYIFVYPKDQQIDNSNFMDYFAFWTGTAGQEKAAAVNNGEMIRFHGHLGTPPRDYKETPGVTSPIPPENLLSHTDGWYCEATENNIGYLMQKHPEATAFVIDVFVEDFAEDGGMDRLMLTFTKTTATTPPVILPPVATPPPDTAPPEVLPPLMEEAPEVLPPVSEQAPAPVTSEEAPKTGDYSYLPYPIAAVCICGCILLRQRKHRRN